MKYRIKELLLKNWFNLFIIIIFIFKSILISSQIIVIKGYSHDDGMFVNLAFNLLSNNWLGEYNDITLSKGIIGILFIVIANKIGISFLFFEHILYFLAILSVISMLKNIIESKKILAIIFFILFINPISYSDTFSFVYRDGIYVSLIILLFSYSFQTFFYYKRKINLLMKKTIVFSIILTMCLLCREESVWLLPFLLVALIIIISFIAFDNDCKNKIIRFSLILSIPIITIVVSSSVISFNNYIHYNRFIVNDFTSKDFKDLYGALTRIKQENYLKRVPLNKETRQQLYNLSPTFSTLKDYLESEKLDKYRNNKEKDFHEGFLYWAIREAAYNNGYYTNAKKAYYFNNQLAKEINDLCDSKKLKCTKERSSLVAPFQKELLVEVKKYIPKSFIIQTTYKTMQVEIKHPIKDKTNIKKYENITKNRIYYTKNNMIIINIMKIILTLFQLLNPVFFIISLFLYFFFSIKVIGNKINISKYYKQLLILNGLLYLYIIRVIMIGYIAATEYQSALDKCQYLSPTYTIQSLFIILTIFFTIELLKDNKHKNILTQKKPT